MTSTAQTSPTRNDAAMLAFKPACSVFGLVANHASQERTGAVAAQYGGNIIAVKYSASTHETSRPKEPAISRAEMDVTELADGQDMLANLFDHEGLAFFQPDEEPYQVQPVAETKVEVVAVSEPNVQEMPQIESPAMPEGDPIQVPTLPREGVEPGGLEVAPKQSAHIEIPRVEEAALAPALDIGASNRKVAAAALLAIVVALGCVYGYTHYPNTARASQAATTKIPKLAEHTAVAATVAIQQSPGPAAAPVVKAVQVVVAAPAPAPQMASTALPKPAPLPSPMVFEQEMPAPPRAKPAPPATASAAPAAKDKIVLLSADEAIAQKEDIPSPGKFVLLKTDAKPAASKFKTLGDAKE